MAEGARFHLLDAFASPSSRWESLAVKSMMENKSNIRLWGVRSCARASAPVLLSPLHVRGGELQLLQPGDHNLQPIEGRSGFCYGEGVRPGESSNWWVGRPFPPKRAALCHRRDTTEHCRGESLGRERVCWGRASRLFDAQDACCGHDGQLRGRA